jgi:hypothetical protein
MKRLLMCAVLLAWSAMASAVVYKWVDAQGKLQYGDRPPDGVHAEVVELLGTHLGRAGRAADAPSASQKAGAEPTAKDTKKAVDQDVADTKEKQCAEAQERYKKLIEGRRLYKPGNDGERQYLTSDEIDTERVNAKKDIDVICNGPS